MLEAFVMGVGIVATAMAVLLLLSIVANIADALAKSGRDEMNLKTQEEAE